MSKEILQLSFSPNNVYIVGCSSDFSIKLFIVSNLKSLGVLKGHSDIVTCVRFCPYGKYIASGSVDKTIKIWNFDKQ